MFKNGIELSPLLGKWKFEFNWGGAFFVHLLSFWRSFQVPFYPKHNIYSIGWPNSVEFFTKNGKDEVASHEW